MKNRHLTAKSFAESAYHLYQEAIKEVNYDSEKLVEALVEGMFMGIEFKVIFYQKRVPCGYIKIPEECRELVWVIKSEGYDYVPHCVVHGGFTFGKYVEEGERERLGKGWRLGWDYGHCDDYAEYMKDVSFADKLKKWTTKEILIDIFEQIITFYDEGVLY